MPLVQKAAQSILARQLPDGGFNIYQQGPDGDQRHGKGVFRAEAGGPARWTIRAWRGRASAFWRWAAFRRANSYVKINLSLFDLYPRQYCPTIPPELMLLGKFIYQMSSWTRAIAVSLAIVHAHNPRRPVPAGFSLEELFLPGVQPGVRKAMRSGSPGAICSCASTGF